MQGYDVIGDVHGCADKLEELLEDLDYRVDPWTGAYLHGTRQAIFVGDLVDRGPSQLRVLEVVKAMADAGHAQMVMGNHEFNALAYATANPSKPGEFLRPHSRKNRAQHEAFLTQLSGWQRDHYLAWFRTLPLWLDLGGLRVVHACWHQDSIELIEERLGGSRFISFAQLVEASTKSESETSLYQAVEAILKGPELKLTAYGAPDFKDKDDHPRSEARVKWWKTGATTLRELAEIPKRSETRSGKSYGKLPKTVVSERDQSFAYDGDVPVVYGHYWRSGDLVQHEDWTEKTACVDFSAVRGGTMVAYQWSGESMIDPLHYHPHGRDLIELTAST